MITPIGIIWRKNYVRCTSNTFDKPYLISEMTRNPNNIEPVAVIDINTKQATIHLINQAMTDFDVITDPILARRVEGIADYMINKINVQKSNLSISDKEETVDLITKRDYKKQNLTDSERVRLQTLFPQDLEVI